MSHAKKQYLLWGATSKRQAKRVSHNGASLVQKLNFMRMLKLL